MLKYEPTDPAQNLNFQYVPSSAVSVGATMLVFAPNNPRLDIIQAAGTVIPEGTGAPVFITLPSNSDTNQSVVVQARNFNRIVPIRLTLLPASGDPVRYDGQVDNSTINPAQTTINVGLPANTRVNVQVWTQ
jgi:hypothetical protein